MEQFVPSMYPDSRNPFAFPDLLDEGLEPWTVQEVLMTVHTENNRFVDITDVFDRKLAALKCHVSQHPDPDRLDELLRSWGAGNAMEAGMAGGRIAEGFRAIDVAPF